MKFPLMARLGTAGMLAALGGIPLAAAHAVAGPRVFVSTMQIDDPGVGDEAALPTASYTSPDGKTGVFDGNFEYDKTITSTLAVGIGDDLVLNHRDQAAGGSTHAGLGNLYLSVKDQFFTSDSYEAMASVGLTRNFGRVGTAGFSDGYNSTALRVFAGKGLGDLPIGYLRPFAVTGELDYVIPDAGLSSGAGNVTSWQGGLSLQYSIPYLESQVHGFGLGPVLANLTPLVELAWSSAAGRYRGAGGGGNPTSFLLAPGAIWTGDTYALGAEALVPLDAAAGHGIGAIAELHFYLDDLFPRTLGKPLFGQ